MCGRFSLTGGLEAIRRLIEDLESETELAPRYNIAPTQGIAILINDGTRLVRLARWGLVPAWARDEGMGERLFNARAETLAEKPSFKAQFRAKRCLVFADGFYEWRKTPGSAKKTPYYIRLITREAFAFAGLWDLWTDRTDASRRLLSATIITTSPNELVAPIHDRMPVILPRETFWQWLAPGDTQLAALQNLLAPYPPEKMEAFPVSLAVNNPGNESPDCVAPLSS